MTPDFVIRWLDRAMYLALPAWVLGTVFYIPRFLDDPFKIGAETFAVACAWLVAAVGLGAEALRGRPLGTGVYQSWAWRVGAAFVLWVALSTLWAPHQALHARFALTVFAYVFAAQGVLSWMQEKPAQRVPYAAGTLGLLVLVEGVLGLLQQAKYPIVETFRGKVPVGSVLEGTVLALGAPSGPGIPMGSLGNQNYLGELLSLCVPVVLGYAIAARNGVARWLGVGVAILGFVVMIACSTRSAFLGTLIGAVVAFVSLGAGRSIAGLLRTGGARVWVGAGLAGVVTAGLVVRYGGPLVDKLLRLTTGEDANVLSRLANWRVAVDMFAERPLVGVGLGGWKVDSVPHMLSVNPEGLSIYHAGARFHQLHNDPFQLFVELGLIGGALVVVGTYFWMRRVQGDESLSTAQKAGLMMGITAFAISSAFGFPFHIAQNAQAGVLVLAMGLVTLKALPPAPAVVPVQGRFAYTGAVLLGVAALGHFAFHHGMAPVYAASEYNYLAKNVQKKGGRTQGVDILFGASVRLDPFKPQHVFGQLSALARKRNFPKIIEVYEIHRKEGLGSDSMLIYGKALVEVGRVEDAKRVLRDVLLSYPPEMRNHALADRYIREIGGVNPRQAEFDAWRKAEAEKAKQGKPRR